MSADAISISPLHAPRRRPTAIVATAFLATWFGLVAITATNGTLRDFSARYLWGYLSLVALGIAIPTLAYFALPAIRALVDAIGLRRLTVLHGWRIAAALLFFYFGARGELPPLFWILAGVGDLITGVLALRMLGGPQTSRRYRRFHALGFTDFVIAVGAGITFTILHDPRMATLTNLPLALVPLFMVGISGSTHLAAWAMLSRRTRS